MQPCETKLEKEPCGVIKASEELRGLNKLLKPVKQNRSVELLGELHNRGKSNPQEKAGEVSILKKQSNSRFCVV